MPATTAVEQATVDLVASMVDVLTATVLVAPMAALAVAGKPTSTVYDSAADATNDAVNAPTTSPDTTVNDSEAADAPRLRAAAKDAVTSVAATSVEEAASVLERRLVGLDH